jgi:hypothetical protein
MINSLTLYISIEQEIPEGMGQPISCIIFVKEQQELSHQGVFMEKIVFF